MDADPARPVTSELAGETDADLMVYMSMAGDDPSIAADAWGELYRRHATYLYGVCLRAYGRLLGGEPGVCDLVAETFKRAYEHAGSFDPNGTDDPDRLRLRLRAWLGRIAQRIAQTMLRGQSRLPTRFLEQEQWQRVAERTATHRPDPARLQRVREAVLSLSEREQMVVHVTAQWYQPDRDHQRLPNDVAADLAAALQTTPENVRQIRRRALKKIEAHLRPQTGDDKETGEPCDELRSPTR